MSSTSLPPRVDDVTSAGNTSIRCVNSKIQQMAYVDYKLAVDVYLVSALCVAGLVGNSLSIAVLRRDRDKPNTTNWLLQNLAAVDMVYLVASALIQPIKTVHEMADWTTVAGDASAGVVFDGGLGRRLPWLRMIFPYIEPHAWAVASIAQTFTVWLVMLVTIDRYVAVCMPMKAEWRSLKRAKQAMFVVAIVAVLYNIPRFFERMVVHTLRCDDEQWWPTTKMTAFRHNQVYFIVYKTFCYFLFRAVGPLTVLIVLNVRLIRALRLVRHRRAKMLGASGKSASGRAAAATKQHENLTVMLVAVVTVFIVCQLPTMLIRVVFSAKEIAPKAIKVDLTVLRYPNVAANAMLTLNSAVNFLIYCLVGKKFRRILFDEMCCRCCCRCSAKGSTDSGSSKDVGTGSGSASSKTNRKIAVAGRAMIVHESEEEIRVEVLREVSR